ncbi:ketoacyl-synt-domain-containing protein [Aspergillus fijiensis CBS 313.89]|uniref:Ketoacyl-synt-domain-containing protein n=1 Tax=Aspergillus fijiensis CBS 313.89 TaxID=1448319 RepID=A0A8G1RFW7_9EURO|nr:ketoacyl-synt-domain-containing protein [Aspergillus fijiensis CBS 313.89]RAK71065.1 ketoacyl-synt-domain-containing protein [Aspergillus fijiensis CBS 313.89]
MTDVAVIGIGLRLPGGVTTCTQLWDMLANGADGWSPPPAGRFDEEDLQAWKNTEVEGAYFLTEDIARFDAAMFRISPEEAQAMDPQQRLLLEVTYEALENGGLSLQSIGGTNTAVFVGTFAHDYASLSTKNRCAIGGHTALGASRSILANRLSYVLNLKGPSMTIDTACSASLVALHQARQAILSGEAEQAIVGGVNLICQSDLHVGLHQLNVLSPSGRSYPFDSRASGYGRGEGCVSVILKRVDAAVRDGDPIRAVIRASGVNSDGQTAGIAFPNGEAQESLVRRVYQSAGLRLEDTVLVEAHGTGTPTGDAVEARAIAKVFSNPQLHVGSVKGNIGHLEGASGLAGLVKAIVCLERAMIPPQCGFSHFNTNIPLDKWAMQIPRELNPWPHTGLRRASVNSFGFGGTNAHVVLDHGFSSSFTAGTAWPRTSSDLQIVENGHSTDRLRRLFMISANDQTSGSMMIQQLVDYLKSVRQSHQDQFLQNLAYSLAQRSRLRYRLAVTASSIDELALSLSREMSQLTRLARAPAIGFVFTGMGAQWERMGYDLFQRYPVVRKSFLQADECLKALGCTWKATDETFRYGEVSRINHPDVYQVITTTLQLCLIDLLSSWNIRPRSVVGHSGGEIAAAYAAGALSFSDALKVAFHRGQLIASLEGSPKRTAGGMLAVGWSAEQVQPYLSQLENGVVAVACYNSPRSVTLAGDLAGIRELEKILPEHGALVKRLNVGVAYHSAHVHQLAEPCRQALSDIRPHHRASDVHFYSSVAGSRIETTELGREYWVRNMTQPVRFCDAVFAMCQPSGISRKLDLLVEVGPHATLLGPVSQILKDLDMQKSVGYASCIMRKADGLSSMLELAGTVVMKGGAVDIEAVNVPSQVWQAPPRFIVDLPPYPWNHARRYWVGTPAAVSADRACSPMSAEDSSTLDEGGQKNETSDKLVKQMIRSLNAAAKFFAETALDELTDDDIGRLSDQHRSLVAALKLSRDQDLTPPDVRTKEEIVHAAKGCGAEGELLCRIGNNLGQILQRKVQPLSLMLDGDLLAEYYRSAIGMHQCQDQVSEAIQRTVSENTSSRMRVLEVGAGTGASALRILQDLSKDASGLPLQQYDFTDISPGFFAKARQVLAPWASKVNFKVLDISKDVAAQGFEPGLYDVIVAADVIHATPSIRTTMRSLRQLLKPGGKLVLLELTNPPLRWSIIFGTLPGWWAGVNEGRRLGPTISEAEWDQVLGSTGFSGLDFCARDFEDPSLYLHSVMTSTAVNRTHPYVIIYNGHHPPAVVQALKEWCEDHDLGDVPVYPMDYAGKSDVLLQQDTVCILLSGFWKEDSFDGAFVEQLVALMGKLRSIIWVTEGAVSAQSTPNACVVDAITTYLRVKVPGRTIITHELVGTFQDPGKDSSRMLRESLQLLSGQSDLLNLLPSSLPDPTHEDENYQVNAAGKHRILNNQPVKVRVSHCQILQPCSIPKKSAAFDSAMASFDAVLEELLHDIREHIASLNTPSSVIKRLDKCVRESTQGGKRSRGLMPLRTGQRLLAQGLTDQQARDLSIIGWILEIVHAAYLIDDDMMDGSIFRRNKLCRYLQANVGLSAIGDALLLRSCARYLLRKYFATHPCYMQLLEVFDEALLQEDLGGVADTHVAKSSFQGFQNHTRQTYAFLGVSKTAYNTVYLPLGLAVHYLSLATPANLSVLKDISLQLGVYFQVQDDYLDVFGDPRTTGKVGTDIVERKCTWLLVEALERTTPEQMQHLEVAFADGNTDAARETFEVLGLKERYSEYAQMTHMMISELISNVDESEGLVKEIFEAVLLDIHGRNR